MSNGVDSRLLITPLLEAMDRVLHHDDRSIDNHSEIDGSKAHQVGADSEGAHTEKADQHRQRNHPGCDDRGSQIAEKQQQNHGDQHEPLEEILLDRLDRAVDDERLIVEGHQLYTRRKTKSANLLFYALDQLFAVFTLEHDDGA